MEILALFAGIFVGSLSNPYFTTFMIILALSAFFDKSILLPIGILLGGAALVAISSSHNLLFRFVLMLLLGAFIALLARILRHAFRYFSNLK
jgi:hypothetical protein